jgi:hypothetical protein
MMFTYRCMGLGAPTGYLGRMVGPVLMLSGPSGVEREVLPGDGELGHLEVTDATPAEKLTLHWSGYGAIRGLEIDPAVPTARGADL